MNHTSDLQSPNKDRPIGIVTTLQGDDDGHGLQIRLVTASGQILKSSTGRNQRVEGATEVK